MDLGGASWSKRFWFLNVSEGLTCNQQVAVSVLLQKLGYGPRELRRGVASRTKAEHDLDHDGSPKNIHMRSAIGGAGYV